ncbi:uncharacterized protein LOC122062169 isoform X2 [Macadamia integrifolia]|nr:uncharacterized protein LOC122062169 isoform X2 [Macadamia integrifolia]
MMEHHLGGEINSLSGSEETKKEESGGEDGKEDRSSKHRVKFCGYKIDITVTNDEREAGKWVTKVESYGQKKGHETFMVGLEVKCQLNSPKVPSPITILQLCVGRLCLLNQIYHEKKSSDGIFRAFLQNPMYTFVGISNTVAKIQQQYNVTVPVTKDIAMVASEKQPEYSNFGLHQLCDRILKVTIKPSRDAQLGDWGAETLCDEQISEAAREAFVCLRMRLVVLAIDEDKKWFAHRIM